MQLTRHVNASDFRNTATYMNGVLGGILAKYHMKQPLSEYEASLLAAQ